MLYNSFSYIVFFLPCVVVIFYWLASHVGQRMALYWLLAASLFFYGYWNPYYLPLLLGSIAINNIFGRALAKNRSKSFLVLALAINIGALCFFKYVDFFILNFNNLLHSDIPILKLEIPIGISFFTFQQIAFLVESWRNGDQDYEPLRYALFLSQFCHLVSGPIIYEKILTEQFKREQIFSVNWDNISRAMFLFSLGLTKKTFADFFAMGETYTAGQDLHLSFVGAWMSTLCYAIRIYFDYSAYIDMARASGLFFNLNIPINFNSPYKASSFRDFWRRWNITLSTFLRDYLYIPLGGNRKGFARTIFNLLATMLIAGLWHGAGWGFIFWGGLHGVFLVLNHLWRLTGKTFPTAIGRLGTFLGVVFAWGLFKSNTLAEAINLMQAMLGFNGIAIPLKIRWLDWINAHFPAGNLLFSLGISFVPESSVPGYHSDWQIIGIVCALCITMLFSNSNTISLNFKPTKLNLAYSTLAFVGSLLFIYHAREFIYFQF